MKTLQFRYDLKIEFTEPVTHHSFTVKCMAATDERQRILQQNIHILPKEFLSENRDSFGNYYFFGRTEGEHHLFQVTAEGIAETGLCDSVTAGERCRQGLYLVQTPCTRPGDGLKRFFSDLKLPDGADNLEKSHIIMDAVYGAVSYRSGSTEIGTTAEEAFAQRSGVCQDYSHIMLSLCRMAGIPCRYVVGMLLGEGASHAWVEVACHDRWYGFDPTNHVTVVENHIKISHGRDYSDCLINQGVFTGTAAQVQSISVQVAEVFC